MSSKKKRIAKFIPFYLNQIYNNNNNNNKILIPKSFDIIGRGELPSIIIKNDQIIIN